MLTKEQLDAIKERVEIATPGEWGLGVYRVYNDKFKAVAETLRFEDAKFIAHARQDVPALIAEVERLQQFEQKAIYAIEENRKLRKALEFYADEDNYNIPYTRQFSDVHNEGGNIARKALRNEQYE